MYSGYGICYLLNVFLLSYNVFIVWVSRLFFFVYMVKDWVMCYVNVEFFFIEFRLREGNRGLVE